mgnify:FL=1
MLGDKLFNFKRTVAGEGFFDELKKEFKSLNQFIEDNAKEFEAIGKAISFVLTVAVKGFALAIRGVAKAVGALRTGYDALLRTLNKIPFVNIEISDTQKAINKDMLDYEFQAYKNNKANESNLKSLAKQKVLTEEIIKILDKKLKGLTNTASQVARVLQMGIDGFSKGLAESIVMGKELNITMKELGRTLLTEVLATLIKIVAQRAVMYSISKAEAQMKSMSGGNGIGSVISGVFGSILGKANGGSVSKGQPYMVGEQGAELFVPNQSGQIQQSARGNEKSPVNVNFNINTLDASGFDELLVRNRGTITQLINNAVNERGSRNLI